MGKAITSQYDVGYFFLAINPSVFQDSIAFKEQNDELVKQLHASVASFNNNTFAIPGDKSRKSLQESLRRGYVEIPVNIYVALKD